MDGSWTLCGDDRPAVRHHGRQLFALDVARHGPQHFRPLLLGALEFLLLSRHFRGRIYFLVPHVAPDHHGHFKRQVGGRLVRCCCPAVIVLLWRLMIFVHNFKS